GDAIISVLLHHDVSNMRYSSNVTLNHEDGTPKLAKVLADNLPAGVVYLIADVRARTGTLTRYSLRPLCPQGAARIAAYTLVEPYQINGQDMFHFDLYRLNVPYELELMGIRDYLETPNALFLFEWPSKGGDEIPQADLIIEILKSEDELTRTASLISSNLA